MKRAGAVGIAGWVVLVAAAAEANIAAPMERPADVSGPMAMDTGGLRVVAEDLSIECGASWGWPRCRFSARYEFVNPGNAAVEVAPVFLGVDSEVTGVRVDERAVEVAALTSLELRDYPGGAGGGMGGTRFILPVAAGARAIVVVEGEMRPPGRTSPSYALEAAHGRHLLLGNEPRPQSFSIGYMIAPIRSWGPAPAIRTRLTHPADLMVQMSLDAGWSPIQRTSQGGQVTQEVVIDGNVTNRLLIAITMPEQLLFVGGPVLGVGGGVGAGGGFRLRAGWEVALPAHLLHAVTVDTDFDDHLVITPMIKAATPLIFFIPSLGLGVGVPIMRSPHHAVGVRIELDLQWPILGFATTFDLYPGMWDDDAARFETAFLARFSL